MHTHAADGLSMGMGEFISGRAEVAFIKGERAREMWEAENVLEQEKAEMVELYVSKGMEEDDAKTVIDIMAKNKEFFVDVMMVEELGLHPEEANASPAKQGLVMFLSFLAFGCIPLLAYIISRAAAGDARGGVDRNFIASCVLTGVALFILGALKAKLTTAGTIAMMLKGGITILFTGGLSALSAFLIGYLLNFIIKQDAKKG